MSLDSPPPFSLATLLTPTTTSPEEDLQQPVPRRQFLHRKRKARRGKPEAKYPYDTLPLSGNWIRILYLFAAESSDEALVGRLETVDLNDSASSAIRRTGSFPSAEHERRKKRSLPLRYEALSWVWGTQPSTEPLQLQDVKSGKKWRIRIPPNLAQALRSLRSYAEDAEPRPLWCDAFCINMEDDNERAHQVAQMNLVYGCAFNVCIWLDDQPRTVERYGYTTKEIFTFIEKELLDLASFDQVVQSKVNARRWLALVQLMTKKWFTRRWIIQEVALARKATVHCGDAKIKWERFAHAVALVVKAESANNQLSEIVRRDETLDHKPGVLRDIDRIGAASLVEITTANFNSAASGMPQPVSSLEALMTMLPMFESSKPSDTIYALLAIAKDTKPEAEGTRQNFFNVGNTWKYVKRFGDGDEGLQKLQKAHKVAEMLAAGLRSKPYLVSYSKKPIDVYQYFVEFCISQSRSLDVICRPWAPKPETESGGNRLGRAATSLSNDTISSSSESVSEESDEDDDDDDTIEVPAFWEARANSYLAIPRSATNPDYTSGWGSHSRGSPSMDPESPTSNSDDLPETPVRRNLTKPLQRRGAKRPHTAAAAQISKALDQQQQNKMPSWIADRQHIAFTLSADESMTLIERKNADPLVGSPDNRPYQASGNRAVRMGKVQFLRRSEYDQSLFVEGFVLDRIAECEQPSDLSNIPPSWFTFAGFGPESPPNKKAPEDLYRTLIADRGLNGARPPPYFSLAYSEALNRDRSITLDNRNVTNEGKSIVSEFLQRVRQVIFGRRLMKTETPMKVGKDGKSKPRLGLVPKETRSIKGDREGGDLICILYGLSVPLVLRRHVKTDAQKRADRDAREKQLPEAYQNAVRRIETHWSFRKELEKTLYYMKPEDIKGKFSKLWLDKIRADFEERARRDETLPAAEQQRDGYRESARPARFTPNRTLEQQDKLWRDMCAEWKIMLEEGGYPLKSDNFKDKAIETPPKEGDDEYYEVIGEAYVDKMMDGEALLTKQERKIPDIVFELR